MRLPGPRHAPGARHHARETVDAAPAAHPAAHHAAPTRRPGALAAGAGALGVAVLLAGAAAALTAATIGAPPDVDRAAAARLAAASRPSPPPLVSSPTPAVAACELPGVVEALSAGDDEAALIAMGGAAAVREAVITGGAPCIDLADPTRLWVVVDKLRPYEPLGHEPADLTRVDGVRVFNEGLLRAEAAAAFAELVAAAQEAGAGQIAITSGYRSFDDQATQHARWVAAEGADSADEVSARPGYSEHQSGLAVDVVACDGACGDIARFASTRQGRWLAENSWRHGFIVRYEQGQAGTTGYSPEPWHIRYLGVVLAAAYHGGGFHTLEDFWGLPAAPDYGD